VSRISVVGRLKCTRTVSVVACGFSEKLISDNTTDNATERHYCSCSSVYPRERQRERLDREGRGIVHLPTGPELRNWTRLWGMGPGIDNHH
jgi:hypothetical protein